MPKLYSCITLKEFELISPRFRAAAETLRDKVNEEKTVKGFAKVSFDITKYLKTHIGKNTYFIAATNVFRTIIDYVLPKAVELYPDSFGTHDPIKVLTAVYDSEPFGGFGKFDTFLSTEQFAFIFEMNSEMIINEKVLRVDLFRLINTEKKCHKEPEFTGGLFHVFKHFSYRGKPLSTGSGEIAIYHPQAIYAILINCFFLSEPRHNEKGFTSEIEFDNGKKIKGSFYNEKGTNVYFIDTIHPKGYKNLSKV